MAWTVDPAITRAQDRRAGHLAYIGRKPFTPGPNPYVTGNPGIEALGTVLAGKLAGDEARKIKNLTNQQLAAQHAMGIVLEGGVVPQAPTLAMPQPPGFMGSVREFISPTAETVEQRMGKYAGATDITPEMRIDAGADPLTSMQLSISGQKLKEDKRADAARESFLKPEQIITNKVESYNDITGETDVTETSVDLNNPYGWTEAERQMIGMSSDIGAAQINLLKMRAATQKNKDVNLKDVASRANVLRDDFKKDTKDWFTIMSYVKNGLDATDNHIGDVTVLFAYLKAIDPGSVVRPGEISLTNPALISQDMAALWNSLTNPEGGFGRRLLGSKRKEIEGELKQLGAKAKQGYDHQSGIYTKRATDLKVKPSHVVSAPFSPSTVTEKLPEDLLVPQGFTLVPNAKGPNGENVYEDKNGKKFTL